MGLTRPQVDYLMMGVGLLLVTVFLGLFVFWFIPPDKPVLAPSPPTQLYDYYYIPPAPRHYRPAERAMI